MAHQPTETTAYRIEGNDSVKRQTTLDMILHSGGGYALFRDMGVMPLTFGGHCLKIGIDAELRLQEWRFALKTSAIGGMFNNQLQRSYDTYGVDAKISAEAMKKIWTKEQSRCQTMWLGAGIGDWFELKNNESLSNVSTGVGNVAAAQIIARYELMMKPRRSGCRWIWHTEIEACIAGALFRPGYPYMDNWSGGEESKDNMFETYEWSWCALPYIGWNTGVELKLKNGNKIGMEYRWMYATTRSAGCYRYEEAAHTLRFNLVFAIR